MQTFLQNTFPNILPISCDFLAAFTHIRDLLKAIRLLCSMYWIIFYISLGTFLQNTCILHSGLKIENYVQTFESRLKKQHKRIEFYHSVLQYSEDIYDFLANFFKQIVKKGGQKFILGDSFINKNNDDFYVVQLCFYDIF